MKTFAQYYTKNKDYFRDNTAIVSEYLMGRNVEVVNNRSGHNYGSTGTIIRINHPPRMGGISENTVADNLAVSNLTSAGNSIYFSDFRVIGESATDIELEIKKKEKEIASLKERIDIMKQHDIPFMTEKTYKAARALSKMDDKTPFAKKIEVLIDELDIV